jgi:hypothetical protein
MTKDITIGTNSLRKNTSLNFGKLKGGVGLEGSLISLEIDREMATIKKSSFQCNPALKRKEGETCLSPEAIERIVKAYNNDYPHKKITIGAHTRKNHSSLKGGKHYNKIWKTFKNAMSECNNELCVLKQSSLDKSEKTNMIETYFRPEKPAEWTKDHDAWLDSLNIEDVMNQYEQADSTFEFIGPVPIDFAKETSFGHCIVDELCKLDLKKMEKSGTKKIGIVFNLDEHDEPGSHWICGYIDIDRKAAYYFDSYGYKPPKRITDFMIGLTKQGINTLMYNDIRFQKKDSECGMYCLYVLICLLKGRSFADICKDVVDDDIMNAFRDILFATDKPRKIAIDKALGKACI